MSGTSLDGIDVAIVEIRGRQIRTLGFRSTRYPKATRAALLAPLNAAAISRLNFQLGQLYARAVLDAIRRFGPVGLIGCHGQTVYHEGGKHTLQIGEPAVVAERTGVAVVSNFRARDIAAGGQGAPLVPFADYLLFRHPRRTRVALNIGGIANVTIIPHGARPEDVLAFDTGPGNMVIDALVDESTKGRRRYDRDGRIAATGQINRTLLAELLRDPYYRKAGPKSAGREQYGAAFVERMKGAETSYPNLIATATALTAATIAGGLRGMAGDLIVSGGGVHNRQVMGQIAALLPELRVTTSAEYGIDPDAKEAIAFAVLAYETWRGRPSNLPSATGAKRAVVLGSVTRG
jgi:anhydro-N-acetylmuramic acid kinase